MRTRPGWTFAALAVANVSYAVSQTLLIPSVTDIEQHVHTTPVGATALMSAFFVSGAVFAGLLGRLGDMVGKQRIVVAQLGLFSAGALLCALSSSLVLLIAGRAVMGLAAALFPLSASIVRDELTGRWLSHGISFLSATIGIGAAIGLACGGLISERIGYHWIFWIPLVMGSASTVAVAIVVPPSSVRAPGRLDVVGALLLGLGLTGPLVAISRTPVWGWTGLRTIVLAATGMPLLAWFVRHEFRHPEPLLDLVTLRRRAVALTNVATLLVGFGMFGASVIMTQFFQEPRSSGYGFGASPAQAGLFLVPGTALMLFTAPTSGRMSTVFGPRTTLLTGTAVASAALGAMTELHHGRLELFLWPTLMYVGIGFAFAAMPMLILDEVDATQRGQATAVNQILRLIGSSVGTQLAATLITASAHHGGAPTESGYTKAFMLEAAGGFAAFLLALSIPRRRATSPADLDLELELVAPAADLS